jgi:hypothetical protein
MYNNDAKFSAQLQQRGVSPSLVKVQDFQHCQRVVSALIVKERDIQY